MGNAALVHKTASTTGRLAMLAAIQTGFAETSHDRELASNGEEVEVHSLQIIRETAKQRNSESHCRHHHVCLVKWNKEVLRHLCRKFDAVLCSKTRELFSLSAIELLVFLTDMFKGGKSYSCLNLACSAVAAFFLFAGNLFGSNPLVSKFMKGVFHKRPSLPQYGITWDAYLVLKFLRKWSPVRYPSEGQLSMKAVLRLVVTGQRLPNEVGVG